MRHEFYVLVFYNYDFKFNGIRLALYDLKKINFVSIPVDE